MNTTRIRTDLYVGPSSNFDVRKDSERCWTGNAKKWKRVRSSVMNTTFTCSLRVLMHENRVWMRWSGNPTAQCQKHWTQRLMEPLREPSTYVHGWKIPVDIGSLSEMDFIQEMGFLKTRLFDQMGYLSPFWERWRGLVVVSKIPRPIWKNEWNPKDHCKPMILPIYEEDRRSYRKIHKGIAPKLLSGIIFYVLSSICKWRTNGDHAGFSPYRDFNDHIVTLR